MRSKRQIIFRFTFRIFCGVKFLGPLTLDDGILKILGDHVSKVVGDGNLIKVSITTLMTRENAYLPEPQGANEKLNSQCEEA